MITLKSKNPSLAVVALACATLLNGAAATFAMAQEGGATAPSPERPCPATGYAEPDYTYGGRNVDGPAPAETASPCIPQIVFDVGDAIGMTRSTGGMLTIKNVIALRFIANGEFAVSGTKMEKVEGVEFQGSYYLPAGRLMIPRPEGKSEIRVFNDQLAWNETSEGVGATPAAKGSARERLIMLKLTPSGALWSAIEAEAHVKVSQVGGKTQLTSVSPYDGLNVAITLDADKRPATVTIKDGKTVYGATFANYHGTLDLTKIDWEPNEGIVFPGEITWTKNGKPWAAFHVTGYFSNPYVVFPAPASIK